jgi:hypothetical protein
MWVKLESDGGSEKVAHKKTILRTFMDPTLDINDGKCKDRILRVRYLSVGGSNSYVGTKIHGPHAPNENLLRLQGLFATLISFNVSQVSMAILQCTSIKTTNPPTYLDAAPIAEISLPETRYEVTGQILSLVPFVASDQSMSWAWTADFVSFESAKAKQASSSDAATRMRHLSIPVNGRLVLPLALSDSQQVTVEEILKLPPSSDAADPPRKTWVFTNTQLEAISTKLAKRAEDEEVRSKIPSYGAVKEGRYPYTALIQTGVVV